MGARYAIVVANYYEEIADRLVAGARACLEEAGADAIDTHVVTGAFELPMAAKLVGESSRYAGIVCLGTVLRGETDHYDHVCAQTAWGIQHVQLITGVPCGFGVLTCDTEEQALARSGGKKRDTGRQAAAAVLTLARLRWETSIASGCR
jgi:6,7-dimethyl-8-ribityllumazine synthase